MIHRTDIERALIFLAANALSTASRAIIAVNKTDKKLTVAGDRTSEFPAGQLIKVTGSNAGRYTVASVVYTAPNSIITLSEALPSAVANGAIKTPYRVCLEEQAAPRMPKPYVTVKVYPSITIGSDETRDTDASGLTDMYSVKQVRAAFNAYGSTANDLINTLHNALSSASWLEELHYRDSLSVGVISAPQDLTELLENKYEPRCFMDVNFYIADDYTDDTGLIETVEFTSDIEGIITTTTVGE